MDALGIIDHYLILILFIKEICGDNIYQLLSTIDIITKADQFFTTLLCCDLLVLGFDLLDDKHFNMTDE